MSESTETTYYNVEPCTLASASHLSTVSEESHDAEEAQTCSSSSTNEASEPIATSEPLEVKNRRCFSKVNTSQEILNVHSLIYLSHLVAFVT